MKKKILAITGAIIAGIALLIWWLHLSDTRASVVINGDKFRFTYESVFLRASFWDVRVNNGENSCGEIEGYEAFSGKEFQQVLIDSIRPLYSNGNVRIYTMDGINDKYETGQSVIYTVDGKTFNLLNRELTKNWFDEEELKEIEARHEILYSEHSKEKLLKWINWGLVDTDKYQKEFKSISSELESLANVMYEIEWSDELHETLVQNGSHVLYVVRKNNEIVGLQDCPKELNKKALKALNIIDDKLENGLDYILIYWGYGVSYVGKGETEIYRYYLSMNTPRFFLKKENCDYSSFDTYRINDNWYYQVAHVR